MVKRRKGNAPGNGAGTHTNAESLLPLRPTLFAILLVLNSSNMHGYGIMKKLNTRGTGGSLLGPGTLYRTLKEMRDLGLVAHAASPDTDESDERRSYYTLTAFGREVVVAEAERIAFLMKDAQLGEVLGAGK